MKLIKVIFLILMFPLITASSSHKVYVSVTKVEFSSETQSVQLITKIFIDDIEEVLQERYNPSVILGTPAETESDEALLRKYILQKLTLQVNGSPATLVYVGREYESDMVKAYIEIENISEFKSIEVENQLLFDKFEEQQNIVHVKFGKTRKSLVLDKENPKGVLNFK